MRLVLACLLLYWPDFASAGSAKFSPKAIKKGEIFQIIDEKLADIRAQYLQGDFSLREDYQKLIEIRRSILDSGDEAAWLAARQSPRTREQLKLLEEIKKRVPGSDTEHFYFAEPAGILATVVPDYAAGVTIPLKSKTGKAHASVVLPVGSLNFDDAARKPGDDVRDRLRDIMTSLHEAAHQSHALAKIAARTPLYSLIEEGYTHDQEAALISQLLSDPDPESLGWRMNALWNGVLRESAAGVEREISLLALAQEELKNHPYEPRSELVRLLMLTPQGDAAIKGVTTAGSLEPLKRWLGDQRFQALSHFAAIYLQAAPVRPLILHEIKRIAQDARYASAQEKSALAVRHFVELFFYAYCQKAIQKNPWQAHFLFPVLEARLAKPENLAHWDDWTTRWSSPAQRPQILGEISQSAYSFFREVSTP